MTTPPDRAAFRIWHDRWPQARRFFVFANLGATFAGLPMGTPAFKRAVRNVDLLVGENASARAWRPSSLAS